MRNHAPRRPARAQVGGKLGGVFDEDPRRWRMVAEAFLTLGLALEIATAFSPGNFIALAGAGNLSRAVGRGMTNPCFRIIQTHFAAANNIGDVAAKEEVRARSWRAAAGAEGPGLQRSICVRALGLLTTALVSGCKPEVAACIGAGFSFRVNTPVVQHRSGM